MTHTCGPVAKRQDQATPLPPEHDRHHDGRRRDGQQSGSRLKQTCEGIGGRGGIIVHEVVQRFEVDDDPRHDEKTRGMGSAGDGRLHGQADAEMERGEGHRSPRGKPATAQAASLPCVRGRIRPMMTSSRATAELASTPRNTSPGVAAESGRCEQRHDEQRRGGGEAGELHQAKGRRVGREGPPGACCEDQSSAGSPRCGPRHYRPPRPISKREPSGSILSQKKSWIGGRADEAGELGLAVQLEGELELDVAVAVEDVDELGAGDEAGLGHRVGDGLADLRGHLLSVLTRVKPWPGNSFLSCGSIFLSFGSILPPPGTAWMPNSVTWRAGGVSFGKNGERPARPGSGPGRRPRERRNRGLRGMGPLTRTVPIPCSSKRRGPRPPCRCPTRSAGDAPRQPRSRPGRHRETDHQGRPLLDVVIVHGRNHGGRPGTGHTDRRPGWPRPGPAPSGPRPSISRRGTGRT